MAKLTAKEKQSIKRAMDLVETLSRCSCDALGQAEGMHRMNSPLAAKYGDFYGFRPNGYWPDFIYGVSTFNEEVFRAQKNRRLIMLALFAEAAEDVL